VDARLRGFQSGCHVYFIFVGRQRGSCCLERPTKECSYPAILTEVDWTGDTDGLDYLIVDTPPGTSDEHISTVQYLQKAGAVSGAVVVTTPEEVSLADVRKELNFCQKTKVPVLGLVENMGSLQTTLSQLTFANGQGEDQTESVLKELKEKCPHLLDLVATSNLFQTESGSSGTKNMATQYSVPYWGSLPLNNSLLKCCEEGKAFAEECPDVPAAKVLKSFADKLTKALPVEMGTN